MKNALFFCLVAACSLLVLPASAERLVLGSVNDNVRKHVDRAGLLAEFLSDELAGSGVTSVEISVLPTSDAMVQALRNGDVHLYFDSPLVAALVADQAGGEPILRRWKRGAGEYHSVIIVPTESEIRILDDLIGRSIGFQDPDSTSGFLLPIGMLLDAGLEIQEMKGPGSPKPDDAVGYVFTEDDKNTMLWLARGQIDSAATDPRAFESLEKARPGQFRIVANSITVPRQVVVASPKLALALRSEIESLLIGLSETEPGLNILKKFHKTTRFDHFPSGTEATFAPIYALLQSLRENGIIQ